MNKPGILKTKIKFKISRWDIKTKCIISINWSKYKQFPIRIQKTNFVRERRAVLL